MGESVLCPNRSNHDAANTSSKRNSPGVSSSHQLTSTNMHQPTCIIGKLINIFCSTWCYVHRAPQQEGCRAFGL